jgi:murein endopeptidase
MRAVSISALLGALIVGAVALLSARAPAEPPRQEPLPPAPPLAAPPSDPLPGPIAALPTAPVAPLAPVPATPATPATPAAPARPSRAIGPPWRGRLVNGAQFPDVGQDWLTWDPILKQVPNRPWRRWGTQKLIATIERVLAAYHVANPDAPQVLVGDLSRPHGGIFDNRYGGLGHASHQNGLDADIYYPRADGALRAAWRPDQIDRDLSQDLVDRFVAAGAQLVFVGLRTRLHGKRDVVEAIPHHDDHMHVRIYRPGTADAAPPRVTVASR